MAKQRQDSADTRTAGQTVEPETPAVEQQDSEPEVAKIGHWQAAHRVVKAIDGDTRLSIFAEEADKLVVESGGKSNEQRAWNTVYQILQSLAELGMVELSEEVTVHLLHRLPSADEQK
jgi:hypothetical protein